MNATAGAYTPQDRALARWAMSALPDFTLADMLAAFTEAQEHRYAGIRACPACSLKRQRHEDLCPKHEADAKQGFTYLCLRQAFERAASDPDLFAHITRTILRGNGHGRTLTNEQADEMLAALDGPALVEAMSRPPVPEPGFIYVIGFSNGTVKVGRSQDLERRLAAHRSHGRKFGADITDKWVSPQHAEWRQNETKLIAIAHELGGRVTAAEYFTGLAFADIVARAQDLPFTSCPAAT